MRLLIMLCFITALTNCSPRHKANTAAVQNAGTAIDKYSITFYGAVPNDGKDDGAAIKKALSGKNTYVYFPPGEYQVSEGIQLPNDVHMEGKGKVTIKAMKPMEHLFYMKKPNYAIQHFQLHNLELDANKKAKNCISLYKVSGVNPAMLQDIRLINAKETGGIFRACQVASMRNVVSRKNGQHGFEFQGCNGLTAHSISSTLNGESGLRIVGVKEGKVHFSGGMNFYGVHAEGNKGNGIELQGVLTPVSIFGGWIEGNKTNGVSITNSSVNLSGVRITNKSDKKANIYPVNICKSTNSFGSNVTIDNSFIVGSKPSKIPVMDHNKSKNTILRNIKNYNNTSRKDK